jgi:hypothetical protein
MRPEDFFLETEQASDPLDPFGVPSFGKPTFRIDLVRQIRAGAIDAPDAEVAVALARLVHDELEAYGTDDSGALDNAAMRESLLALRAITTRIGVDLEVPFRDLTTFRSYWIREGARGSWQARRDILAAIFDDAHDRLAELESAELASDDLADPVSPHGRTGWAKIDEEIAELRRHFQAARTPQDHRNVGNDCTIVIEALSKQLYVVDKHLREGEEEPPVGKTKQRLDRVIEDAAPGPHNAALRKVARATIELAQAVKHDGASTRREAGCAADSVILLANLLRRLDQDM